MKKHLKMIPYLLVNAIAFYLLPIIIKDTGSAMAVVLVFLPLICFLTAIIFGIKNSFNWLYSLAVALLFVPTIFIHYNTSAASYIVAYGIVALVGNFIGKLFYKKISRSIEK